MVWTIPLEKPNFLERKMKPRKIISGNFAYVCRTSRIWSAYGYKIISQKKWGDGKWTFVMERTDETL